MQKLAAICLFCSATSAYAGSFDERYTRAEAACASEGGSAYLQSFYKHVGEAANTILMHCFESTPSANNSGFEVVANVSSTGSLSSSASRPRTNIAACFIERLEAENFDPPPAGKYHSGFPVVLNMTGSSFPPKMKCLRQL